MVETTKGMKQGVYVKVYSDTKSHPQSTYVMKYNSYVKDVRNGPGLLHH